MNILPRVLFLFQNLPLYGAWPTLKQSWSGPKNVNCCPRHHSSNTAFHHFCTLSDSAGRSDLFWNRQRSSICRKDIAPSSQTKERYYSIHQGTNTDEQIPFARIKASPLWDFIEVQISKWLESVMTVIGNKLDSVTHLMFWDALGFSCILFITCASWAYDTRAVNVSHLS